jgi:CO/xanthine dehydrogenase Mo-binding subunit
VAEEIKLPGSLKTDARIDSWISIEAGGTVSILTGKVEYGQGVMTAVAQVGAEELDVALARIRVKMADTGVTVDEKLTAGSGSIEESGAAIRYAAAAARAILMDKAAAALAVPRDTLVVEDGTVKSPATNRQVTYWDLMGGRTFDAEVTADTKPKSPGDYRIVGHAAPRLDIPAKVFGEPAFIQDMAVTGLLHGRVVRPPSYEAKLRSADLDAARKIAGVVEVVRDGAFLGVIAESEAAAVKARAALAAACRWEEVAKYPNEDSLYDWMTSQECEDRLVEGGIPVDKPIPDIVTPSGAAHTVEAIYARPFQSHASIGPSAGMARWDGDELTVWAHSQGIYPLRAALACAFDCPKEKIRCVHAENAGVYGHNGADDAAMDAAMLARAVPGRTVRVQWMRDDEFKWEPYGSGMVMAAQASLDAAGNIIDWNFDVWSNAHAGRPRAKKETAGFIACWHRENMTPPPRPADNDGKDGGAHRGARPYYDFPKTRIAKHFVKPHPFRVSSLRALGTFGNIFAVESMMDELAIEAGLDLVEFRLRHLKDARARAVLEKVAAMADWNPARWGNGKGQGIAFNRYKNSKCYAAVVFNVEVIEATGAIRTPKAFIAADAGLSINPDGVANQLEGGLIQAASWTLKEAVRFDPVRITSVDWETYPILTFREVPEIETFVFQRETEKAMGVGEATQGPTPAAIANAVYAAIGVRLREIPFTPERVRKMISEARAARR